MRARSLVRFLNTLSSPVPHIHPAQHNPFLETHLPPYMMPQLPQPNGTIQRQIRRKLPAVMMRSGTSKGLFLHRRDLPVSESEWSPILISAMGSKNGDVRQLDGIGGGSSVTSKIAVVSKSNRPGIDVDYTFVQVAVGQEKIDMSGNCGNMSSGVGPFALDEGLVEAEPGRDEVCLCYINYPPPMAMC